MVNGYRIGLDIGIGSIGWAVIAGRGETAHIEALGSRLFDSSELNRGRERKSQQRRAARGVRRLFRRRWFRKERLKAHLQYNGLVTAEEVQILEESPLCDVVQYKAKALQQALTPMELLACLLHTCNHRGYRDFYEDAPVDEEDAETEEGKNKQAAAEFKQAFADSGYEIVSQFLCAEDWKNGQQQAAFRNREGKGSYMLIPRRLMVEETEKILQAQQTYHACLTEQVQKQTMEIIFSQRDFEEGPGDASEKYRRYTGFLESLGKCPFYSEEKRGVRCSVIGDMFSVVNGLSQRRYLDEDTGEFALKPEAAKELLDSIMYNASVNQKEITKILKKYHIALKGKASKEGEQALTKGIRFLKHVKKAVEKAGQSWEEYITEPQFDVEQPSRLYHISKILSENITPKRRKKALEQLPFMTDALCRQLMPLKGGGTSNASDAYMCDAIHAFMQGEIYGNFQANHLAAQKQEQETTGKRMRTLPASLLQQEEEIRDNPVVYRAINETRKVVNAIIETYGSPEYINVEVASDVNRSYEERLKIEKDQKQREKENDRIKKEIEDILGTGTPVKGRHIELYRLYEQQEGKCLYSGQSLGDLKDVLRDGSGRYEIDHILPYSLVLDNTLNNKALVYASENQKKGQRTPLMYLKGQQAEQFRGRVNLLRGKKSGEISDRKYQYLMLESIYTPDAQQLLDEWKSRNINDTRYITKYIVGLLSRNLQFSGKSKRPVYGIKGAITSKFRRLWLNPATWGKEEKDRASSDMHHAADAVVIANLTPAWVEAASTQMRIRQQINRQGGITPPIREQMERAVQRMHTYYGWDEGYAQNFFLSNGKRVPSFVPNLDKEVDIRLNTEDAERFEREVKVYYSPDIHFVVPPYQPIVSIKKERRFRGCIADDNPVKVREIDGEMRKISRKNILAVTPKDLPNLYTGDEGLRQQLHDMLDAKKADYTVEKYLQEHGLKHFSTPSGVIIRKVSLMSGKAFSSYYRKDIGPRNYTLMGMPKYYCVEVYRNKQGTLDVWGLRFVDMVKRNKKLYVKQEAMPQDYVEHVCYLHTGDFLRIWNKKGELKFEGYYQSVGNINQNTFHYHKKDAPVPSTKVFTIAPGDQVKLISIDLLGREGGVQRCSAPLSSVKGNT